MSLRMILRILGLLLMMFSLTMVPPILISLLFADGMWQAFVIALSITVATAPDVSAQPPCAQGAAYPRRLSDRGPVLERAGAVRFLALDAHRRSALSRPMPSSSRSPG